MAVVIGRYYDIPLLVPPVPDEGSRCVRVEMDPRGPVHFSFPWPSVMFETKQAFIDFASKLFDISRGIDP